MSAIPFVRDAEADFCLVLRSLLAATSTEYFDRLDRAVLDSIVA